jgi:hypothetical protein
MKKLGISHPLTRRQKLLRILITLAIIISLIIVITPPIISIVLRDALLKAGANQVELEDIDLHPFRGELEIHRLSVRADDKVVMALNYGYVDIRMLSLFKKKIEIEAIELDRGFVAILQDSEGHTGIRGLSFAPKEKPAAEETTSDAPSDWSFGIDQAEIKFTSLTLETPKISTNARIEDLKLGTLYTWDRDTLSHFTAQGTINDGSFDFNIKMTPLAKLPKFSGNMMLHALSLKGFQPLLQDSLSKLEGLIQLESAIDIAETAPNQWHIDLETTLESTDLAVSMKDLEVNAGKIQYKGKPVIALNLEDSNATGITVQDQWSIGINNAHVSASGYRIDSQQLDWSGSQQIEKQGDADVQIELAAQGTAAGLDVNSQENIQLAKLSGINIQGLQFKSPLSVETKTITLSQGLALQDAKPSAKPVAAWKEIKLQALTYKPELLTLDKASLDKLAVTLNINKKGELILPLPQSAPKSDKQADRAPQTDKTNKEKPLAFKIGQVSISKGSTIDVTDASLKPTYHGLLSLDRAEASNIDSSEPDKNAEIHIAGTINRYAKMKVDGTLTPFKKIPDTNMDASINSIDLTRLSPYSSEYAGYNIITGSMDVSSKLKIENKHIKDRIKLELHKIDIGISDQEKAGKTDSSLSIGLPAALAMLKDSNGNIKLDLPIEGDLDDPEFDYGPTVRAALAKALTNASTAYLAYAVQPYGAALLVTRIAGKMVTQVAFDPVDFEPGSKTLPASSSEYLEKISTLLKSRPGIELQICGVATMTEFKEPPKDVPLEDALTKLAGARAFAIKDALIKNGVEEGRLLTCLPAIDKKADAKPRVDIKM